MKKSSRFKVYTGGIIFGVIFTISMFLMPEVDAKKTFHQFAESDPDPVPCRILIEQSSGERVSCHAKGDYVALKTPEDMRNHSTIEVYDRKSLRYLFKINRTGSFYRQED